MINLTIKRSILEDIVSGKKLFEYRSLTPYYERLLKAKPKIIKFFFYTKEFVLIEVKKIQIIETPKDLDKFVKTSKCYKLTLGKIFKNALKKKSRVRS